MRKTIFINITKLLTVAALATFFCVQLAYAANTPTNAGNQTNTTTETSSYTIDIKDKSLGTNQSEAATGQISSIVTSVTNVLFFAAGAAAVIFLAYGSVAYITSAGDETKTASARRVMINAVIGVILVSMTYTIFRAATKLGSNLATSIPKPVDQ